MSHSYTDLLTHIVFSTKGRAALIDRTLGPRLHTYLGGIIRGLDGFPIVVGGVADHVHLLVELPAKIAVANAIRDIKSNSSGWIHKTFPKLKRFAWQSGYGAFSVSRSNAHRVQQYIENQEEHHRRQSFTDEFLALLKKHGIRYDPETIWD